MSHATQSVTKSMGLLNYRGVYAIDDIIISIPGSSFNLLPLALTLVTLIKELISIRMGYVCGNLWMTSRE